ncbi:unnamed protein product [Haemonchus placei]|uniref:Uncharacterized protein n=1 Tax=Haemonchus placei TaxID=6290 RepID=A0A0N4WNF8_HAEPC|nr:unnamed protein product [Haemonchus placei]
MPVQRTISKFYPLEIRATLPRPEEKTQATDEETESTVPSTAPNAHPRMRPTLPRAAKTKAYEALQQEQQERFCEC